MSTSIWFWVAFHVGVLLALVIDLAQFKRRDRELSMRAAARRSLLWVFLSLGFNAIVWYLKGPESALEFFTGYLIEYSLSVDNIFVFVLIFTHFRVSGKAQHRVLVWGILGALVMRGIMIWLGVALVSRFHYVLYLFGVFLLITAIRMFFGKTSEQDFGESWWMRSIRKMIPVTRDFYEEHFKAYVDGRWMLTPLALVLIVIDLMDLVFAVDSIPAVFAITQDQFIVYTSNICAILGLRSLYFLLANLINRFIYLKTGISLVLAFVGIKMIIADHIPLPNWISLAVILLILTVTISVSMLVTKNGGRPAHRK
ncbi:MAG: tellurite resistance protein TerC [Verrucomicrobiota bacterium]